MYKTVFWIATLIISAFLGVKILSSDATEFFLGSKWKKRTAEVRSILDSVNQIKHYEIDRYENSDFVKLWGGGEEYISLGSTEPKFLINTNCVKVSQFDKYSFQCSYQNLNLQRRNLCFKYAFPDLFKNENADLNAIMSNYTKIAQFFYGKKTVTYFDEDLLLDVTCQIFHEDIPAH